MGSKPEPYITYNDVIGANISCDTHTDGGGWIYIQVSHVTYRVWIYTQVCHMKLMQMVEAEYAYCEILPSKY